MRTFNVMVMVIRSPILLYVHTCTCMYIPFHFGLFMQVYPSTIDYASLKSLLLTQYGSDVEYRSSRRRGTDSSHRSRRPRSAVRFRDEVRVDTGHLHDLHRSVRDLSADHERLETELEREIRNRYRYVVSYSLSYCDFLNNFCAQFLIAIWLSGDSDVNN